MFFLSTVFICITIHPQLLVLSSEILQASNCPLPCFVAPFFPPVSRFLSCHQLCFKEGGRSDGEIGERGKERRGYFNWCAWGERDGRRERREWWLMFGAPEILNINTFFSSLPLKWHPLIGFSIGSGHINALSLFPFPKLSYLWKWKAVSRRHEVIRGPLSISLANLFISLYLHCIKYQMWCWLIIYGVTWQTCCHAASR